MSRASAWFFERVQQAHFYQELHRQAVSLLPPAQAGQRWFDVGCGPGLLAHLAQARGYQATGFDVDAAMLARAQRSRRSAAQFRQASLQTLASDHGQAQVVSAASLLYVVPDAALALAQLLAAVAPGGVLLVVETSPAMAAASRPAPHAQGPGAWALPLWAWTRRHRPAVEVAQLCPPGWWVAQRAPLLEGWVHALVLRQHKASCWA